MFQRVQCTSKIGGCSVYKIKCSGVGSELRWVRGPRGDDQRLYLTSALTTRPIAKVNVLVCTNSILITNYMLVRIVANVLYEFL
jgi:hypothetical protein